MSKRFMSTFLFFLFISALNGASAGQIEERLLGFSPESSKQQIALEEQFDSLLDRRNFRPWMERMTAKPHHLGSAFGKEVAEFIAEQFRSWGYETEIEKFDVLFPTPKQRLLEMTEPEPFIASLNEPALKQDRTSGLTADRLPPYNAYSIDGDVTGQLVYANYGLPKDYEYLDSKGINVKGKIIIVRYGGSWRGIKPKVAAEHGAIGCLIYSDPRDDGYFQGDDYPKGSWRNERGAQRGSVLDMPIYPGDPLTPGTPATKNAKRLPTKDAKTLTQIPVLPISYGDALPLLRSLGGRVAPEDWRGTLPLTYHTGPGPATVHLKLEFNWDLTTIHDVIARIRGAERPDQWVIRGNHHDAWVFGAYDPVSGLVSLMEEARGLAALSKSGWRPKRTIIYCAWDGEEPGLMGSTEWVEAHEEELSKKAVVYVNSDSNGAGFLSMGGTPSLEQFMNQAARSVIDPQKAVSVLERARAFRIVTGDAEMRQTARQKKDLPLAALGSGSDYTPFLQHLGIPALNLSFFGEEGGGSYHSIYDSFDYYARFVDPDFEYGVTLAKTAGRAILRFADADVLPYEFLGLSEKVDSYLKELVKLTENIREANEEKKRLITEKSVEITLAPKEIYILPQVLPEVPYLNFSPLQNAAANLRTSSLGYQEALNTFWTSAVGLSERTQETLNQILLGAERALLRTEGLPGHPWFRHQLYAPGRYTGYDVKTIPGVREAIEQRNWEEANREIELVARTIDRLGNVIDRASTILKPARVQ